MEYTNCPVAIALICDDCYVTPTCVVIQSLIETKKAQTVYDIHIICASLSEENANIFLQFNSSTVHIHIVYQDANLLASLHTFDENSYCVATPAALLKFMLPTLLDSYEKVLYLDGDILVREDLSDLFATNLGNAYLAAVIDSGIMYSHNKFIDQVQNYFNSGVMLINLAQMRHDGLTEKLIQAKADMQDSSLMDQNVFNCVCVGKVVYLPIRYNFLPINLLRAAGKWSLNQLNQIYGTSYVSESSLFQDAAIIHFASKDKPWKDDSVAFADDWFQCYWAAPLSHTLSRSQSAAHILGTPKISIILPEDASDKKFYDQFPEDIEFVYEPGALEKATGQYIWFGRNCELSGIDTLNYFHNIAVSNNLDVVLGDADAFSKRKVYPSACTGQELYSLLTLNEDYFACVAGGLYRRDFLLKHQITGTNEELFMFKSLFYAERVKALNKTLCHITAATSNHSEASVHTIKTMMEVLCTNQKTDDFIHAAAINIYRLLKDRPADFEINISLILPILGLHTTEGFPCEIAELKEYRSECIQLRKEKVARWEELQALYKEKGERWKELQSLYKEKGERWKELQALYKEKRERWEELNALKKEKAKLMQEVNSLKKENAELHASISAARKSGLFTNGRICFRIYRKFAHFLSRVLSKFKRGA